MPVFCSCLVQIVSESSPLDLLTCIKYLKYFKMSKKPVLLGMQLGVETGTAALKFSFK